MPARPRRESPIAPYLRTQARSDSDIRKFLMAAARGVKSQLDKPIANALARQQPELVMRAITGVLSGVWRGTENTIRGYRPQVALDSVAVTDSVNKILFEAAGVDYKPIQRSLQERALFAVEAGLNRFGTQNIPLSAAVHRSEA